MDNPDLQRILAGLNGADFRGQFPYAPAAPNVPGLELLNAEPQHVAGATLHSRYAPGVEQQHLATYQRPLNPGNMPTPAQPRKAIPDASTITTWPAALRHVTKYIVTNEKSVSRIKHLIVEQHKHEREWWAGREALIFRLSGRVKKQMEAARLLKSLGGSSAPLVVSNDPKVNEQELKRYDEKVYSELTKMARDFDRQLRNLGVPFFAIRHDLVKLGKEDRSNSLAGKLDKGELRDLQKRLLETLEDLVTE